MVQCWAPDCTHYSNRDRCKFYRFPKKVIARKRWINLLRRNTAPTQEARVCSCHFGDGLKENGPEIFLHNESKRFQWPDVETRTRKKKVGTDEKENVENVTEEVNENNEASTSGYVEAAQYDYTKPDKDASHCDLMEPSVAMLQAEIYFLKKQLEDKEKKIQYMSPRFCFQNISGNDELVRFYTGIPSTKLFLALYKLIENIEVHYFYEWNVQKLDKIDQLFLTLIKLRLNLPRLDLAQRFAISTASVSNVVITFVSLLYELLYDQFMSVIPSKEKNRSCLPSSFSTFTNCRCVLDCTEIITVKSRKSMKIQSFTYSSYKHNNTWKALVGVAPNGVVTYVSNLYPGSMSDKKIVKHCGILEQLKSGDLVVADKGFLISDLLPYGVSLNLPPFLNQPQFTEEQVARTESIARCRVHVERAIRRIKEYRILNFLPQSYCQYGDKLLKCIAALTNMQYPLIKEVEEYFSD